MSEAFPNNQNINPFTTEGYSYIDEMAAQFASRYEPGEDYNQAFKNRKSALLAKQQIIVNDHLGIQAAKQRIADAREQEEQSTSEA